MVLGIKWLQLHDVRTKWASNITIFNSLYCKENYLPEGRTAIMPDIVDVPDSFKRQEPELIKEKELKLELDQLVEKPTRKPYC